MQTSGINGAMSRRQGHGSFMPSSHPHVTGHDCEPQSVSYHWHDKQELMQKELEEARARATQMEKTMRWWSDCTANWREKWSKVRSERNKAREEVRLLRSRVEGMQRESNILRREKADLESKLSYVIQPEVGISKKDETGKMEKFSANTDSPERDNNRMNSSCNNNSVSSTVFSTEQLQILAESKGPTMSLFDDVFVNYGVTNLSKGVEDVSVYAHSAGEASRLVEKSRSTREGKDVADHRSDKILDNLAQHDSSNLPKENDVEERIRKLQDQTQDDITTANMSGTSSSQASPSHRISTISDPLPETYHASPRASAISDPLSEVCGESECSETGYADSIKSTEDIISRRWRTNDRAQSGVGSSILDDSGITPEQESLEQQVVMLKLRLEEASKTIQAERGEKHLFDRESIRWQNEIAELKARLDDVRASRQEAVKELVGLRAAHQKEIQSLQLEMLDEASSRECVDRRLADLRSELERLQQENAAEWGKRERIETEKLSLERENKKLRSQILDLEARLDKRNKMLSANPDTNIGSLKDEIAERNKELAELKHSHNKLKKVLADKSVELQHSIRRGDQYENEVKRLRSRVEDLKKELAAAEDEVDCASNNIRKLHRTNDELQENVENLQVQVGHLQSRLRSSQTLTMPLQSRSLSPDSQTE